jgi:predicted ATPase/DNA-binding SARP family transcriptional activator
MVVVRLLGPVDVVDSSGSVHAPDTALRRTLLALLAMRAGEVLATDWLLEHAWNGRPPGSGSPALRFHISRLRRELGESIPIDTSPGGYRLAVTADQVDALAVEGKDRAARGENDPAVAAEMYAEMLAMWRGAPFVDVAPCATLDDEAGRLAELRVSITEACFQARLDAGAGRELVADLARATRQHPLRESMWSMLITAQYRSGLQADALRSFERMRALLADSLGLDPSTELQDLQGRVLQHDPSLIHDRGASVGDTRGARPGFSGNLPTPATPLIDGDNRLSLAMRLLEDHRLVTLTGTGGVGKTRLAVELGCACLDRFEAGVWMIELGPVANADAVVAAIASTLSIRPQHGSTLVESMVDWFRGRELLLIIDNCEHVLDPVRQLLTAVLPRCPTVKVVATSRESLGLAGERVHSVNVLNPESDGAALFLDRATAADSYFTSTDVERVAITEICRRLDGLPLAIELAAARVRSMAPVDLLARLDDRFRLLRRGARNGLDRHGTLLATVEWSYQLLTEPERAIFDRLSVFAGDFDLRAAEVICAADVIDASEMVDLLTNLVDKSMVSVERTPDGTRFRLLETLREFGQEMLRADGDSELIRERHLRHYVDVAEQADAIFRTSREVTAAAIFDREWGNLRVAHEWAILTTNVENAERLLSASRLHAVSRMRFEHAEWAERTVALGTEGHPPSPDTLVQCGYWAAIVDNMPRAKDLLFRAIDLLVSVDDPSAALCLSYAEPEEHPRVPDPFRQLEVVASKLDLDQEWWVLIRLAQVATARQPWPRPVHVTRLVETAERIRAPMLMAAAATMLGHSSMMRDPPDYAGALESYVQGRGAARQSGDVVAEGECLRAIALATFGLDPDAAIEACHQALIKLYEIRYWPLIWQLLDSIALCLASTEGVEAASVVVGNLEAHHPPFGYEHRFGFRSRTLEIVQSHSQLSEWMARGAAMDRYEIVELALAALERKTRIV